jgi:uncharacterized protein (TIGR02271 family)
VKKISKKQNRPLQKRSQEELDTIVIPVVEEHLKLGKRHVITGRVTLHKTVEEYLETVDLPLLRETVEVTRVPLGEVVSQPSSTRQEGDTLIIPVFEEILVVEKRYRLIEEIHVRTERTEHHNPQQVVLRREKVTLERDGKEVNKVQSRKEAG